MVKHTAVPQPEAPAATRSGKKNVQQSTSPINQSSFQQGLFLNLALDMTWQLAIVVIVPIVGGYLLDHTYKTTPWLTLTGFVLTATGVVVVLKHIVRQASTRSNVTDRGEKS